MSDTLKKGRNWIFLVLFILAIPVLFTVYVFGRGPYLDSTGIVILAVGLVVCGWLFYLLYRGNRFVLFPLTGIMALNGLRAILNSTRGMAEFYVEPFLFAILEGLLFLAPIAIVLFVPSAKAFLLYQRTGKFEDKELESRIDEIGQSPPSSQSSGLS